MEIGVLLGKKLDSVEDQFRILSRQLKLQQPFIRFLEKKFQVEFEEFMSNVERFEGTDFNIINYECPSTASGVTGYPNVAKTVDTYQLNTNAGIQSSTKKNPVAFVVDLTESVSNDGPVISMTSQLSSSISTTIFPESTGDPLGSTEVDTFVRLKAVDEVIVEGTEEVVEVMGLPSKGTEETGPLSSGSSTSHEAGTSQGSNVPFGGTSRCTIQSPSSSLSKGGLSRTPKRKLNENDWEKRTQAGSILSKLRKRFPSSPEVNETVTGDGQKHHIADSSDDNSEEEDESDGDWSASGRTSVSSNSLASEEEDVWECPVCKKSFSTKKNLKLHKVTHSIEKEFKCLLCPKSFRSKGTLKNHQVTHTNEKNFKCHFCAKYFRLYGCLSQHIRRKHCPIVPR